MKDLGEVRGVLEVIIMGANMPPYLDIKSIALVQRESHCLAHSGLEIGFKQIQNF